MMRIIYRTKNHCAIFQEKLVMTTSQMKAAVGREKKMDHADRKLTKVLSTKVSIEDYKIFRILTNHAYRNGTIN